MKPILLVDGDALAYRIAAASEQETEWSPGVLTLSSDVAAAKSAIDLHLQKWMARHNASGLRVALSDTPWTFRMSVYPAYKAHRKDVRKPLGLAQLRQHLMDNHGGTILPGLEADDLMGLWMTDKYRESGIIVSWDKDMRAVPGRFWVPGTEDVEERDEIDADKMWMAQTLSGDQADGYPGCRNIGVVRAKRIVNDWARLSAPLLPHQTLADAVWPVILKEFLKKGHTEQDAIVSARLARILRHGDYDLKTKEVKLWVPPGSPSSSPSTPTRREPVRARARGNWRGKHAAKGWPSISCRSRSRSVGRPAGYSPLRGRKKRYVST